MKGGGEERIGNYEEVRKGGREQEERKKWGRKRNLKGEKEDMKRKGRIEKRKEGDEKGKETKEMRRSGKREMVDK